VPPGHLRIIGSGRTPQLTAVVSRTDGIAERRNFTTAAPWAEVSPSRAQEHMCRADRIIPEAIVKLQRLWQRLD
jgi:hypothetical protein